MILDDVKSFLTENNIARIGMIKYDYDSAEGEDVVLLQLYESKPCDIARRSCLKIFNKFSDLETARNIAFSVHDLFFPLDCFQKAVNINGKTMHVRLNNGPFYQGKDASNRHNYVLDITLTYDR